MTETLEMKINKNTEIVFDFYVDKILPLVKIKNKNVILIGLGNTKFIKQIKSIAKNVCIIDHCLPFERDYKLIDENQLEIDIKKYLEKNNMPKFDVAIMNPPYDGNLHLKILEKVIPIADKVVNISPNDFYTNPYSMFEKEKQKREAKEKIASNIVSEEYIPSNEFNKLFGTNWGGAVSIMFFDKNSKTRIDTSSYESKNKLLIKIIEKIIKLPSIRSKFTKNFGKNYVLVRRTNHRYLNWCEDNNKNIKAVEGINFKNKNEEQNFRKSFSTWFYKYLSKTDWPGAENSAEIPYMSDYTQPWDDKRFCEYFGITGYISDTEAEPNSEWEIILNTMKEYV